jgi:hypothetical protein
MTSDPHSIVDKLTEAQRRGLAALPAESWGAAHEFGIGGNVLSVLADKGLLDRKRDPFVWGRSVYQLNESGLAVRSILEGEVG